MTITEKIQEETISKWMSKLFEKENNVTKIEGSYKFNNESPARYDLMTEAAKYGKRSGFGIRIMPMMFSILRNEFKTVDTLSKNPKVYKSEITEDEINKLEEFAKKKGADLIGFTKISNQLVFKNKGVLHPNAIVLGFEMQKDRIDTAPSLNCQIEVMRTYDKLGMMGFCHIVM